MNKHLSDINSRVKKEKQQERKREREKVKPRLLFFLADQSWLGKGGKKKC